MEIRASVGNLSRNDSNNNEFIISGYAIKWGKLSNEIYEDGKSFKERIRKGAFAASIKRANQLALCNHLERERIGSAKDGTLFLEEDDIGLFFRIILPENDYGEKVYQKVERRSLPNVSICFSMQEEVWKTRGKRRYRTVRKAILKEISLVRMPAHENTIVVTGDRQQELTEAHEWDEFIRNS